MTLGRMMRRGRCWHNGLFADGFHQRHLRSPLPYLVFVDTYLQNSFSRHKISNSKMQDHLQNDIIVPKCVGVKQGKQIWGMFWTFREHPSPIIVLGQFLSCIRQLLAMFILCGDGRCVDTFGEKHEFFMRLRYQLDDSCKSEKWCLYSCVHVEQNILWKKKMNQSIKISFRLLSLSLTLIRMCKRNGINFDKMIISSTITRMTIKSWLHRNEVKGEANLKLEFSFPQLKCATDEHPQHLLIWWSVEIKLTAFHNQVSSRHKGSPFQIDVTSMWALPK